MTCQGCNPWRRSASLFPPAYRSRMCTSDRSQPERKRLRGQRCIADALVSCCQDLPGRVRIPGISLIHAVYPNWCRMPSFPDEHHQQQNMYNLVLCSRTRAAETSFMAAGTVAHALPCIYYICQSRLFEALLSSCTLQPGHCASRIQKYW